MEQAPSVVAGHKGSKIWYVEKKGYIIEVMFDDFSTEYAWSICTFTPTMGMDSIDGAFAEDS
jgi:hypothetical protein